MELNERLRAVKLWLCDVDGVLTDGRIVLDNHGNELKFFDVRDGHGMAALRRCGIRTGVITGRSSQVVTQRARELGLEFVVQGSRDKRADLARIIAETGLSMREVGFMGDDVIDLPVLSRVGFAAAPADAHAAVKDHVHYVATAAGGRGAVREVADMILEAQGLMEPMIKALLGEECEPSSHG